jgi:hypothetical protein
MIDDALLFGHDLRREAAAAEQLGDVLAAVAELARAGDERADTLEEDLHAREDFGALRSERPCAIQGNIVIRSPTRDVSARCARTHEALNAFPGPRRRRIFTPAREKVTWMAWDSGIRLQPSLRYATSHFVKFLLALSYGHFGVSRLTRALQSTRRAFLEIAHAGTRFLGPAVTVLHAALKAGRPDHSTKLHARKCRALRGLVLGRAAATSDDHEKEHTRAMASAPTRQEWPSD